jgi:hypothetical protein
MKRATTYTSLPLERFLKGLLVAFSTRGARQRSPIRSIRFDGILLLAWRITLLGGCAYGFMLGTGG